MHAHDPDEVRQRLTHLGYSDIELQRIWFELPRLVDVLGLVTRRERVIVARQLQTMLNAGLPALQCVSIIKGQWGNRGVRRELEAVEAALAQGRPTVEALKLARKLFARAPELDDVNVVSGLDRFARRLETDRRR